MKRTFGIVAASALALGLSALAFRLFILQRPSSEEPSGHTEATQAEERAPAATVRVQLPSSAAPGGAALAEGVVEPWRPASIVETLETSRDARELEAALGAVLTTYSSRSTRKPVPGADLERALARHVRSDTGAVARAALAAARVPLMTGAPGAELVNAIVAATGPEEAPARRTLALDALDLIRPDRRDAPVLAAVEQALSASQPEVVSQALLALAHSGPSLAALSPEIRLRLGRRVLGLLEHSNPGVRGRSLFVLAELGDLVGAESRLVAALQKLNDREPYVRAEAASLVGRCGTPPGIHALMEHIQDFAVAGYDLPYVDIEGRSSIAEHRVPGRPRVAEAALFSILALSRAVPLSKPLELPLGRGGEPETQLLEHVANVRQWYGEVASQIPR